MKINIFGVGRSGTKAIQLYLSYLLIKKEGKVRINYEPYYWMNRKTQQLNFEGIFHHITSNLSLNEGQLSKQHTNYLNSLISGNKSVVTKFIRANGRIKAINQIMQPDLTIVVIRDLHGVLNSLSKHGWDLLGENLVYPNDWSRFLQEIKEKNIIPNQELEYCLNHITDRMDRNAFYWYIMNILAIDSHKYVNYYIEYSDIKLIEKIATQYNLLKKYYSIHDKRFTGSNIYNESFITEVHDVHNSRSIPQIGSYDVLSKNAKNIPLSKIINTKNLNKDSNDFYDYLNNNIKKKLLELNRNQL
ncbi:hypothetical protein [Metabacillus elymi]|uniref:Sulfotransferase domain-containing protein n=1 Tax=Metabacillus elymi TaxID=2745198 RepID=A0ABX6S4W2_9BACI|nr:hypothetical protein [Metabacillus sp. KUDC1714]QNF28476.1 hypothetical protein HUW50_13920 [Metabacillus sp. KUDC1714]